ncbi:NAD(P)-binding protein [Sodiomyces alkalinus F11]|uniref:NAD(P)-binding protein n=1 Tax=Sodiomyces alkalinus (strain CBS 110278 / VKM F-3762 / F11) TaxID=1314773 RepID=A0A3N2Q134_SODAK|nr:NAD(P)-binding protein [Sodiomyces alkalinus F11]ROT40450.1 NAD(P)-binding protein [Sodiomyces alkalinus F11]
MVLPTHSKPTAPVLSHFHLGGKTALVTGGCRGIGLEAARGLAEAGAKVAITYSTTDPAEADRIAASLSMSISASASASGTGMAAVVRAYQCDVTSRADVEATMEKAARELGGGRLDICVANAGIAAHIPALEYDEEAWRQMLDVNFHGAFWTAQAAARIFERQEREDGGSGGRASIIFTSSVSGILVNVPQKQAAYNASKAAVTHLAKSLAVEWVDFARVNCISPGFISTDSE